MLNTYVAETDEQGNLNLPEGMRLPEGCKVLITVLQEEALKKTSPQKANDEALLSESALEEDWDKPEEDDAWNCLNREK